MALVVGNSAYVNFPPLSGSRGDADEMARILRDQLHFEVIEKLDVGTMDQLGDAIEELKKTENKGDIVVFYYSGHGFTNGGEEYLVPTGAAPVRPDLVDLYYPTEVGVRSILERKHPGVILVMLDSCRTVAKFTDEKGLGVPPPEPAPDGDVAAADPPGAEGGIVDSLVSYATVKNRTAIGRENDLSYYTKAMTAHLPEQIEFREVARLTRIDVRNESSDDQSPPLSDNAGTLVYLKPSPTIAQAMEQQWKTFVEHGDHMGITGFLASNAVSPYAADARQWLNDHAGDVRETFTQVSATTPEQKWTQALTGVVSFERFGGNIAVSRTLDLSDVPENVATATKSNSLADLLRLQGSAFVAQDALFAKLPTTKGAGKSVSLPRGTKLTIQDGVGAQVQAMPKTDLANAVLLQPNKGPAPLVAGRALMELFLDHAPGGLETTIDASALGDALTRLSADGHRIGWVSIATPKPKADTPRRSTLLRLQALDTKYFLAAHGVPESKITTVEGADTDFDSVRIRIFGF